MNWDPCWKRRTNGESPAKAEEEQACPVPQVEEEEEEGRVLALSLQAHHTVEKVEEFVCKVWEGRWRAVLYDVLPTG